VSSLDTAPSRSDRGGALGSFLAVLTSLLLLALVFEGGLRLLPVPMKGPVVGINDPHEHLGWTKRRSAETAKKTSEFDISFAINELGLREDEDLSRSKPKGEKRVLVVGDSFVLGYTVSREDLFVDRIERALQKDGREVEVLNGGTEGYATDQELVWLREEGLSFEPDVVVLCFYQNDVYWNGQNEYAGTPKPRFPATGDGEKAEALPALEAAQPSWFARHSALVGLFYNLGRMGEAGKLVHSLDKDHYVPKEEMVVFKNFPAGAESIQASYRDAWARTAACLRGFRQTCTEAGTPLLVVAIPSREQIHDDSAQAWLEGKGLDAADIDFNLPTRRFLKLAEEAGIQTLDAQPMLGAAAAEGATLYFENDWHLNIEGNRVLAEAIYEQLVADGSPPLLGGGSRDAGRESLATSSESASTLIWPWVLLGLWLLLSVLYSRSYSDESFAMGALKVGGLLGVVVGTVLLLNFLISLAGPSVGAWVGVGAVALLLGFVLVRSRSNIGIITEVYTSFVRRGHWYMIPLVVVMLAIGSLLIVASSSPFVAPFIYTLF